MASSEYYQLDRKNNSGLTSREIFDLKAFVHDYLPKELFGWAGKPFDISKVQTQTLETITKRARNEFHTISEKIQQLENGDKIIPKFIQYKHSFLRGVKYPFL